MSSRPAAIIHQGVALMICQSAAILEEALLFLDGDAVFMERIGERAIVLPVHQLPLVEAALHQRGIFPRVVAPPPAQEASS